MKLKVIITGVTGIVGEGVLQECIVNLAVEEILVIGRRSSGVSHSKVKEILYDNFNDMPRLSEQVKGYDACFFCLGTSSAGMTEARYFSITHTLTLNFARELSEINPQMIFCYVSGLGTDSSESGKQMWARVKGKTENDLMKLPFMAVYNFRPGFLKPSRGAKKVKGFYYYATLLFPLFRKVLPDYFLSLHELGKAMIHVSTQGYQKKILETRDIVQASNS